MIMGCMFIVSPKIGDTIWIMHGYRLHPQRFLVIFMNRCLEINKFSVIIGVF